MKNLFIIIPALLILLVLLSLSSCKVNITKNSDEDTTKVTKTFDLKGFDEIDCAGAATIHFTVSDTFSVKVVASKSQMERLEVKLKGKQKQLSIGEKSHKNIHILNFNVNGSEDYEVYISAPTLRGIDIAGSMDFECADTIKTDKMNIDVAGSADVRMKNLQSDKTTVDIAGSADLFINFIESGSADIDIAGSADVTLNGKLRSLTKDIAGSGDINTDKLKVGEVTVKD